MTITEKTKSIDDKIEQNKTENSINRQTYRHEKTWIFAVKQRIKSTNLMAKWRIKNQTRQTLKKYNKSDLIYDGNYSFLQISRYQKN